MHCNIIKPLQKAICGKHTNTHGGGQGERTQRYTQLFNPTFLVLGIYHVKSTEVVLKKRDKEGPCIHRELTKYEETICDCMNRRRNTKLMWNGLKNTLKILRHK